MTEFLSAITTFWPVITGMIGFIFTLAILWQKTEMSMNAVKKLFLITDDMLGFKRSQETHNEYMKENAKIIADQLVEHSKMDAENNAKLVGRVDQIFALLMSMNK